MAISLLSGAFFAPLNVNADLFSSIFGNQASADTNAPTPGQTDKNSQNMPLLQANVSSVTVVQDKNDKSKAGDQVDASAQVNILSDNALLPAANAAEPSGAASSDPSSDQVSVYVVRAGDTLSQIADMFGVSVNTILWANNMKKGDKIAEGDVLFILPISGLEHMVTKGQTLQSIAKLYKVDVNDIIQYNGLSSDSALAVGDKLIIPNGLKSDEGDKPVQDLGASIAKDNQYYQSHPTRNLYGYFINPVPGARKSQGIHANNAIDLAISPGTPIHAAASGVVILARNGYNGGFGNLVIINHPNGTQTLYAHQSRIATHTGAEVSQGEVIGYVGSTGRATGPHLHFEVHGARNPGSDGSWAQ